jgi:hypothetical protein
MGPSPGLLRLLAKIRSKMLSGLPNANAIHLDLSAQLKINCLKWSIY